MQAGENYSPVRLIECETPLEFLKQLEPSGNLLNSSGWIFRGLSSAKHSLSATVFRDNEIKNIQNALGYPSPLIGLTDASKTNCYQILSEVCMLIRFVVAADHAGLDIPGPTTFVLEKLSSLKNELTWILLNKLGLHNQDTPVGPRLPANMWPISHAYQVMALARHAGIPTRLLDWSLSPHIAAYFACEEFSSKTPQAEETVCVWALNSKLLDSISLKAKTITLATAVNVLKEGNYNMVAQRGIFTTISVESAQWYEEVETMPLDKRISKYVGQMDVDMQRMLDGTLLKITLPSKKALIVLGFLRSIGISRSTMFPEYREIANDFREELACATVSKIVGIGKSGQKFDPFAKR